MTTPRVWNTEPRSICIHSPAAASPAIHPEALSRVDRACNPWPFASSFFTLEYVRVPEGRAWSRYPLSDQLDSALIVYQCTKSCDGVW